MSAFDVYCALDGSLDGAIYCNEKMAHHTTYRLGGPADLFIECATFSDLTLAVETLEKDGIPWMVIGKGSNLLVSDEGYRGAIIVLGREFRSCVVHDDYTMTVGCAQPLSSIVNLAFQQAYAGFEFAVGVPGTLGGALSMNAGTRTDWIGSRVKSVTIFLPGEGLKRVLGSEIEWYYRGNSLPKRAVILEAELQLSEGDQMMIRPKMEASLNKRKKSQPLSKPNCGSVFKNPENDSSSRLIESCGLKGYSIGGAQVSELHANFIVNNGNATAHDVASLIKYVRDTVKEDCGVELQPEVRFVGFE